jgi:lipopolysaccharide transport protein LptA
VHLRSAAAELRSNTASASFTSGQIAAATVRGTPAVFEQRNAAADKNVRGRAHVIDYDFSKGTVTFTQDVWFSYGGNEFRGDTVVYNLRDERLVVNPTGTSSSGSGRVNITIRPGGGLNLPGTSIKRAPAAPTEKK